MKIPAIKKLVEQADMESLRQAEQSLYDEQPLPIEVDGEDEGEKLTHVLAAIYIKERMAQGDDFTTALRAYSQRVRNSIN
ncbi:MAG: hypothetical protein N2167_04475 [Flavobacteriales bacterium]|nr:hypothetical protein [Flavobacteriales bacterium]